MHSSATVQSLDEGLGRKKTMFVMVTVVGCIAILCPMLFGSSSSPPPKSKDYKVGGTGKCCDVILDKDAFMNVTATLIGPQMYRKRLNLLTGELTLSLRQERPPHLRPDSLHPAMRERGRAIPTTQTVPIVDRPKVKDSPPRIVEGRPGPIPGMRPPMGAGSVHQPQPKGSGMGFIMPLYTVGIIAFFLYTVMKLMFKKQVPNAPYGPIVPDPKFRKEVFGKDATIYSKKHDESSNPKIGWKEHDAIVTAIQGLIDAADEQLKRRENATDLSKETFENSTTSTSSPQNGNIPVDLHDVNRLENLNENDNPKKNSDDLIKHEKQQHEISNSSSNDDKIPDRKKREGSAEISVTVLGMELTASCEGGHKWGRPTTPVFFSHHQHSHDDEIQPEPQSIYLEGALPHESQILVADSETHTENVTDPDLNGTDEEPAVILSSKMTLSLINLSSADEDSDEGDENALADDDGSPLDEDMEIIEDEDNGTIIKSHAD